MKKGNIFDTHEKQLISLINFVSRYNGIPISVIRGRSRKREIVFCRQVFCWLVNEIIRNNLEEETVSLDEIGKHINRDHSTVIHSIREMNNLMETNKFINNRVLNMLNQASLLIKHGDYNIDLELKVKVEGEYSINESNNEITLKAFIGEEIHLSKESVLAFPTGVTVFIPKGYTGYIYSIDKSIQKFEEGERELYVNIQHKENIPVIITPSQIIGIFVLSKKINFSLISE